PANSWRGKAVKPALELLLQAAIFLTGFLVKGKGKKNTWEEVPIFLMAPHSTFFDTIARAVAELPSVFSASQNPQIPLAGKFLLLTQPVLGTQEDPYSKKNTWNEILKRVTSYPDFPGVCAQSPRLGAFKLDAFFSGVPLQHPTTLNMVTWTWQEFTGFQACMLTLHQSRSLLISQIMSTPFFFASTVLISIANAVGAYTGDCRAVFSTGNFHLPMEAGLVEFTKISQKLKLDWDNIHKHLDELAAIEGRKIGIEEFSVCVKLPVSEPLKNSDGDTDFREHAIGLRVLCNPTNTEKILQRFKLFDFDEDFTTALQAAFRVPNLDVSRELSVLSYKRFKKFALKHPIYAKLFNSYLDLQAAYIYSLLQEV
uniref:Lysophosphatidylcholine acyltransferase 4 n=1 Tax=Otolemur garnettii TaxID=30611 RepID=H0XSR8_OTOGA